MELHGKHVQFMEIKPITLYESRLKASGVSRSNSSYLNERKSAKFENLKELTNFSQGSQIYPRETQSFDQNPLIIWNNHKYEISTR